jgi:hypothetical protein
MPTLGTGLKIQAYVKKQRIGLDNRNGVSERKSGVTVVPEWLQKEARQFLTQ